MLQRCYNPLQTTLSSYPDPDLSLFRHQAVMQSKNAWDRG